ncbi:MAG: hypothetical protein PSV17_03365 [Methylotenera sp.]|uniref:hypothetical protein n=1 Tax=Methylotenera sp. TaxID=2051956 RepID=UPI002487A0E2|nr:hypothetical protein [Methylotenera sp.]MDI1308456.1 hypothetical protein [Methylotenera sp.]
MSDINHLREQRLTTENKMDFICSFDMSEEMPHFRLMPEDVRWSAEANVVGVIYESFVVPGDQDYLMSRLLAQKGLHRGFYWAAAQATEKYLKAFLLMNGVSVKNFKLHPIKALYEAAEKVDPTFANFDISPHQGIQVEASVSEHLKKFTIIEFLEDLETHGSADNRYNTFGVDYNTGHLFAMDSLTFHVRGKIGVPAINDSSKKLDLDLQATFEKINPWFQTTLGQSIYKLPTVEFPIHDSVTVTKFEILLKNKNNPANSFALRWLRAKMKLPKEKDK